MSHHETPRTYEPTPLSLTDDEEAALKALADDRFEGNRSMAARYMIRHFATCQFPLIGIDFPGSGATATGACSQAGACVPTGAGA